ncbi:TrkH family potassium uptake protein [Staphylococcus felis]|uniref:TrkH family potassium uptake protein n=1 Tax=Staphylococcus felis TaxID=46127 RepID=UPI000E261EF0|nr:TrkH family potassium uptake protein [Staphylococcus felis]REH97421.1 TrkH family potassium uptake protein [Staphylococcus felis]REI06377.1 TrkH family potassium uptake protein [Staphylococcus felis]REI23545.1 TrkH family potassium uptake protein [Staphylococcus felis]REI30843.1 TrkH family potassium uptake protein [Staphylococcus felis]
MYSKKQPIVFYIGLFLTTTLIGSLLLYLPWTGQKHTHFIDALYVATSAFTVTGLSTVDISSQFNIFGQTVIMLLIQIGGMGIVAVSMFALKISQKHISIHGHQLLQLELNTDDINSVTDFAKFILIFNILFESLGTFILSFVFIPELGWSKGLFTSLFTSISALNNAGFSLFSDNLVSYAHDPVVNLMVAFLIVVGGVGYVVLIDVITTPSIKRLQLHTKVTLSVTFILIVIGFVMFFLLEHDNTLKGMSISNQLLASFFQSVTTRTAGFNTIDFSHLAPGTLLFTMLLMFIGAGPISAAGGIKVTTFALATIYVITSLKGHEHAHLFKRSIPKKQMQKAVAITLSAFSFVILMTLGVAASQPNMRFEDISFEVVSAFGTVGLSTGISSEYGSFAKVIIIISMIAGKIGVLTLLGLLQRKTRETYHYAKGNLYL